MKNFFKDYFEMDKIIRNAQTDFLKNHFVGTVVSALVVGAASVVITAIPRIKEKIEECKSKTGETMEIEEDENEETEEL